MSAQVTTSYNIGRRVEDLMHYRFSDGEVLAPSERAEVIEHTLRFEECAHSRTELQALNDADLVNVCYWAMADYARGQM